MGGWPQEMQIREKYKMLGIHNTLGRLVTGGKMHSRIELVVEISDQQADYLFGLAQAENLSIASGSVDGLEIVTFISDDLNRKLKLKDVIGLLEKSGAKFLRVNLDLVGVPEIAEYAGVNPETVRLWHRGQRRANFPKHYVRVGASQVWLWSEVAEWLRANGQTIDPDYDYVPLCGELKLVAA